ncbi:MAG: hypothetical protein PHO96_06675 [Candidatus Izemoplasmatales bacterium]|nr:hypothetical protein [Candidatus Izemoplasmatales bacterium]
MMVIDQIVMPVGDWKYHRDSLCDYSLSVMGDRSSGDDCERWQMTDWDELIDEVENWHGKQYDLVTAQEAGLIRENLSNARTALLSAILEVETERDNLKTVLHGNQDADYDKQLQIETLKSQLAEAEADADRLAKELYDWLVFTEANDQIYAARSIMNAMLHHQKRKEGK